MKQLLFLFFLTITVSSPAWSQIKMNVPVPSIFIMSDTTTSSTGAFKTSTVLLKRRGFLVYSLSGDSLNSTVTFKYLDANKIPIDTNKYVIWLSREKR